MRSMMTASSSGSSSFLDLIIMIKRHPSGQIPYIWIDHRIDVPTWLAAEIGRIAVEWSGIEWRMEEAIRLLIPTHVQHSRIIATGMSMRSRLKVAENLVIAYFHNGHLPKEICDQFRKLKVHVENQEPHRNKLIHGIWGWVSGSWELIRTSGARELSDVGSLPRPVIPQREVMTPSKTKEIRVDLKLAREMIDAFHQKLEEVNLFEASRDPSLYRSPRQIRQSHPTRARRTRAPAAPLPPFRLRREPRRKK
jgi:hypothetical protein